MKKVSVVVLNWNGEKFLQNCFSSMSKQTYRDYETILVDNGSTDGSVEYVMKNFPKVRVIKNKKNLGFAEGNNVGIRNAKGEYIILLNNDIKLHKDFIKEIVKVADSNRNIGMIAPKMVYFDTDNIDTLGLRIFKSGLSWDTKEPSEVSKCIGPCAGAALYRKKMLEDIKINGDYFEKDFFIYCEDLDLGLRAKAMNWNFGYAPKAIVHHLHSATMRKQKDKSIYLSNRNSIWVIIRNFPTRVLIRNLPWILVAQIASVLVHIKRGKTKVIFKSKFDSFKYLNRVLRKRKIIQSKRKISEKEFQVLLEKTLLPKKQARKILAS